MQMRVHNYCMNDNAQMKNIECTPLALFKQLGYETLETRQKLEEMSSNNFLL